MGLDSVELILAWEESFGITISDAEAATMFTTRLVTESVYAKIRSDQPEDQGCLSLRAFFRLRKAFAEEGISRQEVRPDAKVADFVPRPRRREILGAVSERAGLGPLKRVPFALQFTFGRVRDMVSDAVIGKHEMLRLPGHGWSQAQVREVVRAVLFTQQALRGFSDDDKFVEDLGIN
ncbi:MAG: hypothetical protein HZA31_08345 [Opitutae bacterium]|nr:hypothetical protein [Opitutae bacterium]